jgi:pimeloyl-ACP methyl ester carboxylesterase
MNLPERFVPRRKTMLVGWIALAVSALLALSAFLACRSGPAPMAHPGAESINELRQVELGGLRQWISIRGSDVNHPILLFLHGGPGSANIAKIRMQSPELEDHFVVVNWDQRGSGKTGSLSWQRPGLTLERLRADTHELVLYLRDRFGGRKIYLLGFSWGTVLGLLAARDYPEDLLGYIGVSQIVDAVEGERISLAYVPRRARETDNRKAMEELAGIDPACSADGWYEELIRQRGWLLEFGGVYHTASNYNHEMRMLLGASEYSLMDFAWWPLGQSASLRTLWPDLMGWNFLESADTINVPVSFLEGRYDYNAPSELVQAYFERLRAPRGKRLIWFEESAHDIFFDQPRMLADEVIRIAGG